MYMFRLLLVVTFFTLYGCRGGEKPTYQPSDQPNILLILSDDHSYPYLGCYGNENLETPNLNKLASEGALFNHAYTTASQCVPSRASILTGRNVIDIEMSRFSAPLSREIMTIPDYLGDAGYFTGICGRHYHLDGSVRMPSETKEAFEKHDLITFPDRVDYLEVGEDEEVLGQFKSFLDKVPDQSPFFMWMNYSDPHRHFTADGHSPDPDSITLPATMPDTEAVRKDLAGHLGEIMRLDEHVGQVMEELGKRELRENTVVIFMGDNGAALLRGKGTLYDLGLHVPLIVRWPGKVQKGTIVDEMVSGKDIAPTILEAANVAIDSTITGRSFVPLLKDEAYEPYKYLFAQRSSHSSGLPLHTGYFDLSRSIYNKKYKLIYNALWQLTYTPIDFKNHPMWKNLEKMNENGTLNQHFRKAFFSDPRPMFELYDLEQDPGEFNNLSGKPAYDSLEHTLKGKLHEWMIVNEDFVPLPIPPK